MIVMYKFNSFFLVVLAALITSILPALSDYCAPNLCKFNVRVGGYIGFTYKQHIACGNSLAVTNAIGPSCYRLNVIPMTANFIDLILRQHNTHRANTANGRIPGYLPANQMSELVIENHVN